ncbi:MAG TPA: type IV pilus secretin PilQ [Alphaproteobacteria bacterium]|nr:type IV pilus secretin PilQ [Alphaproteobacteria bacterium]
MFEDHTLVTIQADEPIRYAVRREESPPRLIVDLPGLAVAPGVRSLEINRGGITLVQPINDAAHHRSRVEIGLQPPVVHTLSLPFSTTLLVDIRAEASAQARSPGGEHLRWQEDRPTLPTPHSPKPPPLNGQEVFTLGHTVPGNSEQATELIGVVVEPLADRARVRIIGNGPILTYRTARMATPPQLILTLPALTTDLADRSLLVPSPYLKHLAIRQPDSKATAVEMTLGAGVSPQVAREGALILVELAQLSRSLDLATPSRLPQVKPTLTSAQMRSTVASPMAQPLIMAQGSGQGPQASEATPVYTGQRISLDFQQADLIDVLRLIAEVSGMNIITSPEVSGRVTTRMVNVPWDQALDMILKTFGLGKDVQGTIIRVAPLERLRKERDDALQAQRVAEDLETPITRTIQLKYARAEDLKTNMEKLLTRQGRLDIDKRTNTIIIKDVSATVDEIINLIQRLDSQTRQVSIDTRIVETNRTFLQELGIRWGGLFDKETGVKFPRRVQLSGRQGAATPVGGNFVVDLPTSTPRSLALGFSLISNSSILDVELQALERTGRGRIISNPKVVTLDNKEAIIESGDEVPFRTESAQTGPKVEFKDAKITLKVTPHVTPDDYILLEIDAAKKEVDFTRQVEGNPTITSRQSKTSILVKDGATAVIGGLFKQTRQDSRDGVPGLSRIPYLGWLFKTESEREVNEDLLFFITPRIVRENPGARPR